MEISREFLGLFERCDRLVSFWSKWQATLVFIFYPLWPFIFLAPESQKVWGWYIWLMHAIILLFFAILGFFKAKAIGRTLLKAVRIVSRHHNKILVALFKKNPQIIFTILVLEFFLPLTWVVSFPLKFLFYKNISQIKALIIDRKNLD